MDNQRIQNHENKNQLVVIKGMANKNNKELINYIESILNEPHSSEIEWLAKLKNIPKGGLKGLIYYKIIQMKSENIKLSLDISSIKKSIITDMTIEHYKQLCRIIGVYIDNAIEAAKLCSNGEIGIEIYNYDDGLKISISNTFINLIDLERIECNGFSTKGKGRGHGLELVKSIINKNNNFYQYREIINLITH